MGVPIETEIQIASRPPPGPGRGPLLSVPKGGWISGPQSGYPVSLDGGRSTAFIGHGTEYVAQKSRGGFVVPFDTPATRKDPGLTGRRMGEARTRGYKLPGRSEGGPINVNNFFPEFAAGGKMKNQNTLKLQEDMHKK